jgi:aryl-alcohol dehydrogenase-like predicted oxidoreductase
MESCHASLRRLEVDYLDLYFCHRYDPETPLEEVVRAMDDLIHQGKVLYWGTSVWRAGQIANAYGIARQWGLYPPSVEQPQYNMLVRELVEDEIAPAADDLGYGIVTWSPLRSGLLSGKYNNGRAEGARLSLERYAWIGDLLTEENLEKVRLLSAIASDLGISMAQLAIGWILRLPQVTSVITGATSVSHIEENVKAWQVRESLDQEVIERIEAILGK